MGKRIWSLVSLLMVGLLNLGCQKEDTNLASVVQTNPLPLASLTDEQAKQKQLALAAKDELFATLLNELMQAMSQEGPVKSIKVCKVRAPEVSSAVGQNSGLRIGRTSFQLRNPENRPPGWAEAFVEDRVDRQIEVELGNDGLGVLLPIHLKSTCLLCHGPEKQLMPDLKAAIVSNYPDDQATGFSEGDLRGYFWVEVPSQEKVPSPEN